ncbi:MAG: hypothetical protein LBB54_06275 [Cellulomonadaceae bacterium]|nr:hypothetical protein [Cellulomonadaceae bacterium]
MSSAARNPKCGNCPIWRRQTVFQVTAR